MGLKILWVNNVANIVGGTLNCTHSMVKAFPDCQNTVFSFSGQFGEQEKLAFGQNVELVTGLNVRDFALGKNFDLIVYQNTSKERIPNSQPDGALAVHYLHSGAGGSIKAHESFPVGRRFCVSQWLSERCVVETHVLHQPVTLPYKNPAQDRCSGSIIRVGRMCTPTDRKWRLSDWLPVFRAVKDDLKDRVAFDLVGCPTNLQHQLGDMFAGCCYQPSYNARSLLHSWDVLLYSSTLEESFGRTVREAQRCGCMPIVSNLGGFKEQITPSSGYLCDTVEDFVKAVRETWERIQAFGRSQVQQPIMDHGNKEGSLSRWREAFLTHLGI